MHTRHEAFETEGKTFLLHKRLVTREETTQISMMFAVFSLTLRLFASDGSIHLKVRQVLGAVAIGWHATPDQLMALIALSAASL